MGKGMRWMSLAIVGLVRIGSGAAPSGGAQCCGDCDSSGSVSIDELVTSVNNTLDGCALPLDLRQAFLASPEVQSCSAKLVADGFMAGDLETTAAIDSLCNVSVCEGSSLVIQHFTSSNGEGKSVVAVVTFHISGGQPTTVEVVNIPPFNTCAP